jgi:molybdopterin molybdotransferase
VPVRESLGRVLAQEIVPSINVPGHDNSAMDGFAVRSADFSSKEVVVREIGTAFAGRPFNGEIQKGQCVRVMTGAVMPRGADTVVVQEAARSLAPTSRFRQEKADRMQPPARPKAGVLVLEPGHRFCAATIPGASLGIGEVR